MRNRITLALMAALISSPLPLFTPITAAGSKPVVIRVDDDAAPGGDGSGKSPFKNLPDAVAAARARQGSVVIKVEPGEYPLTTSLVIDVSVDLRGSTEQVVHDGDPWPTGEVRPGTETRVFATGAIGSQPLVQVGRSDGVVLNDVSIRGFAFAGTTTGIELLLTRVQGFKVVDNVFRAPANFAFQSVASSGQVTGNHMSGVGTGAIFTGGYPESPSRVVATGNRAVNNNLGGILLNGASINIPELGDELHAILRGNDLSDNVGSQGFGLRIFILRRDPGAPGDSQASARVEAVARDNRIKGNRIGVTIDAGFPYRRVGTACDPRVFSGAIDLEFAGNTITDSLVKPALITFTRNMAALSPSMLPQWQYLHTATFTIADGDGTLADAWIDHPETDPFIGPCPADATQESLGNVLIYNGATLPNGRNF